MPDRCHGDGKAILGPSCRPLLEDFVGVMANQARWPRHICQDTAWRSTDVWLEQSGLCAWWPSLDELRKALDFRWPWWPLELGKLRFGALLAYTLPQTAMVPRAAASAATTIESIRGGLPFEGNECALFAVRLTSPGQVVDFFGLSQDGTLVHTSNKPELPTYQADLIGSSMAILRGADAGRAAKSVGSTTKTLSAARKWWGGLKGQRIGGGGRHKGDGDRWPSDETAMREINEKLRMNPRLGALALATLLGVDRSTIYRRVESATKKRFAEYVSSREFVQQK